MAKKKKDEKEKKSKKSKRNKTQDVLAGRFDNHTYRDLKKEAVIRGMPFPDAVAAGIGDLISWIENSNEKPDSSLLVKYDDWVKNQLEMVNETQPISLRLSYVGDEADKPKEKKEKPKREKKPKRERDEHGLYKGTKKSYTFELAKKGKSLEKTIKRVLKKFPDASEKSISIWYKTATREK